MSLSLDTDVRFFRFFCSYYPSEQKLSFTYNNGGLSLLVFYAFNIDLKEGQSPKEYKKREKSATFIIFTGNDSSGRQCCCCCRSGKSSQQHVVLYRVVVHFGTISGKLQGNTKA